MYVQCVSMHTHTRPTSIQGDEVEGDEIGDVESLEALLAPASLFPGYDTLLEGEGDEGEDDPDLQDEPVLQVDLQVSCLRHSMQGVLAI